MLDLTYNPSAAQTPVRFAVAENNSWEFKPHDGTWGDFVSYLLATAQEVSRANISQKRWPVMVPVKFDDRSYEARYRAAQKEYQENFKKSPPTKGRWWAEWVTKDIIAEIYMLVFDLDTGGFTAEQIRQKLAGYEAMFWETKRATPEEPRWRVVLLLKRPFIVAYHDPADRLWKRAYTEAAKQFGFNVDRSCTDLCRRCTLPIKKTLHHELIIEHIEGEPFNIHHKLDNLPDEPVRTKMMGGAKGLPSYWKSCLDAIPNDERQTRLTVGMALHHASEGSEEGLDIWFEWAQSAWTNHDEHVREWEGFDSDRLDGRTWASIECLARKNDWKKPLTNYADRWAICSVGGKTLMLDMEQRNINQALMKKEDFILLHQKDFTVTDKGKVMYAAKQFIDQPPAETQVFPNGLCFKPDGNCPEGAFNLYRGLHVAPSEAGSCEMFKRLLKEVWAAGDEDLYMWDLEYLYHLVAFPGDLVGTSIAIRGDGGEGKSFVIKMLRRILGDMLLGVSDQNQVLGQFNEPVVGKLAIVLEEAAFAGDKKLFDRLKEQVTGETVHINPKGRPAFTADNFARMFILSNHLHFLTLGDYDRRYTVQEASNAWKGRPDLFDAAEKEWMNGGAERFVWEALHHEFRVIEGTDTLVINKPCKTAHAELQHDLSRDPIRDAVAEAVSRIPSGYVSSTELLRAVGVSPKDRGATGAIAQEMRKLGWKSGVRRGKAGTRGYEKGEGGATWKWDYELHRLLADGDIDPSKLPHRTTVERLMENATH